VQLKPAPSKAIKHKLPPRELAVIRLPSFEEVANDQVLYAHANRILHLETNPGNARAWYSVMVNVMSGLIHLQFL
jgi:hypothetical protein